MINQYLSRKAVRNVDDQAINQLGITGVVLMENAARGCVDWLCELGVAGPVCICAGKGNNGGDGFVIARHLENRGFEVRVLLFANPTKLTGDALINFEIIHKAGSTIVELHDASPESITAALEGSAWIIDALLGTGTRTQDASDKPNLREPFRSAIPIINQQPARRFAIDLPSGMDCDSGAPIDDNNHCIQADFTATFVAKKIGFKNKSTSQCLGNVRVIDIGVPVSFLSQLLEP
jgi:NAD(P)H-hydrate epimerase